ncbi:hypothetical protein [Mesorhizobium sp.]|nr:hypothetical protein [Mesorhizobium sp.]
MREKIRIVDSNSGLWESAAGYVGAGKKRSPEIEVSTTVAFSREAVNDA